MSYYFSRIVDASFDEATVLAKQALKEDGFGILTEIDVRATLRNKLGADFRNYRILGACNPPYAHEALRVEDKIGTMLPCNVIVQELAPGRVEIAAVDPIASMQAVDNPALGQVAFEVQGKLRSVIESL